MMTVYDWDIYFQSPGLLGGHSPRYFDVVSTTVLLVQLAGCKGFVWYLYMKLGFK